MRDIEKKEPPTGEVSGRGSSGSGLIETTGYLHSTTGGRDVLGVDASRRSEGPHVVGTPAPGVVGGLRKGYACGLKELRELEDRTAKRELQTSSYDGLIKWLCEWGFTAFWSLTFNPKKFPDGATASQCSWLWRHAIVERLNTELFGNNYRRIVGHSYFGYVVGIEPHKSGLLHMHAVTTGRTNWSRACEVWQSGEALNIGTIAIRRIGNLQTDVRYVMKYVTKGGELLFWKPDKLSVPPFIPMWYRGNTIGRDMQEG